MRGVRGGRVWWGACVVLVVLVGGVAAFEGRPSSAITGNRLEDVRKRSVVALFKNILVFDSAYEVSRDLAASDVGYANGFVWCTVGRHLLGRLKNRGASRPLNRWGVWRDLLQAFDSQFHLALDLERWTLPKVSESDYCFDGGACVQSGFYAPHPSALVVFHEFNGFTQRGDLSRETVRLPSVKANRRHSHSKGEPVEQVSGLFAVRWQYWLAVSSGAALLFLGFCLLDDARWLRREGYFIPWGLRRFVWGLVLAIAGFWLFYHGSPIL